MVMIFMNKYIFLLVVPVLVMSLWAYHHYDHEGSTKIREPSSFPVVEQYNKSSFSEMGGMPENMDVLVAELPLSSVDIDKHKLTLLALFQTDNQSLASAVIYIEGIGAYRYQVGDFLGPETDLVALLPDRALVRHQGHISALYLQALGSQAGSEHAVPGSNNMADEADFSQLSDDERRKKEFLARVDLHPVSEGMPFGYIVGDRVPSEVKDNVDIVPGDIILSLNGYPLGEHSSDFLAWDSYQATQRLSVVVRRDGDEFVITYP